MSLIDQVFSWSIDDVLNNDLYKGQVKKIPKTFSSPEEYLESFITPLIEETRNDLCSNLATLSESLCIEIESVEESERLGDSKDLLYKITLIKDHKKNKKRDGNEDVDEDELGFGDLIAITNVKPRRYSDLDRPGMGYLIAFVEGVRDNELEFSLSIVASKPIDIEYGHETTNKCEALYAVKLTNMITNIRIWTAIKSNSEKNLIIQKVLQTPVLDKEYCTLCQCEEEKQGTSSSDMKRRVLSSDLNESQKASVLSCFDTKDCHHDNTVKLIWGPPGTGKTKTVAFLLHSLLEMKCRTLTCAPTNVAVLEVTKRLVKGVARESPCSRQGYGLGDIVLLGNNKRMKIENHEELYDVFLDHRVKVLNQCYHWRFGWKSSLVSMISLLDYPGKLYQSYLKEFKVGKDSETIKNYNNNNNRQQEQAKDNKNKVWKQVVSHNLKDNKNKVWKQVVSHNLKDNKNKQKKKQTEEENEITNVPLSFDEFVRTSFGSFAERLYFCIDNMYKHLPPSYISLEEAEKMFAALDSLKHLEDSLRKVPSEELKKAMETVSITRGYRFNDFIEARIKSLVVLKSLPPEFQEPYSDDNTVDKQALIRRFCLENAVLIFCTVSGSAKLHTMGQFELLVIDEAAQLKECESVIPLQLHGIRHAILIGDEKQLPAMVTSKISEEADFGRSLYERLAILGHKKLLLNVQHRMHPSISLFPNREFYDNMILDGQNVKLETYCRSFLPGEMYGSYSFINVPFGKEEFDHKYSRKNMVEVAVVSHIVSGLHKEIMRTKKKVRVGVISPYKAQVKALTERFGKRYSSDAQSDFSLRVRSVDGFQGGEEDIIIISTVRCNKSGSVGFLSNCNRSNVALTRARHCLWIVGNGTTLSNSLSVWKKLIIDAKERNCFHNAADDQNLTQVIISALLDLNQIDVLGSAESLLFRISKWKVSMSTEFWRSLSRVKNNELRKRVFSLLEKLSSGWRQTEEEKKNNNNVFIHSGSSSLFIEYYNVEKQFYLAWAVDIPRESSSYTQVLKVWDILPSGDIPKLASQLDLFYGNLTVDNMTRCNHKLTDGSLVVPMTWPVALHSHGVDTVQSLDRKDKPETSSKNIRNRPIYQKSRQIARDQIWRVK